MLMLGVTACMVAVYVASRWKPNIAWDIALIFLSSVLVGVIATEGVARRTAGGFQDACGELVNAVAHWSKEGILATYPNRVEALKIIDERLARPETHTVWAMGVTLDTNFRAFDRVEELTRRKIGPAGVKLRVLMLDSMTSPSVFLELLGERAGDKTALNRWRDALAKSTASDKPKSSPSADSSKKGEEQEHKTAKLREVLEVKGHWQDDQALAQRFSKLRSAAPSVRFYAHVPSVWMVRVDDRIFFQQLTLSSPPAGAELVSSVTGPVVGGPVIEVTCNGPLGSRLIAHFDAIWETSNIDVLRILLRKARGASDLGGDLRGLLESRRDWLKHVLQFKLAPFRRRDFRHECTRPLAVVANSRPGLSSNGVKHVLNNYSLRGAAFTVECPDAERSRLLQEWKAAVGEEVTIEIENGTSDTETIETWELLPLGKAGEPKPMLVAWANEVGADPKELRVGLVAPT